MLKSIFSKVHKFWWGIWFIFYLLILSLSIIAPTSFALNLIKVLSILGCLIFVCLEYHKDESLMLAMFLTLVADFLLAFHENLFYGTFTFFITQLLHFYRLTSKFRMTMIYGFIALICIFFGKIEIANQSLDPMIILCLFYAGAIIANIVASALWHHQTPKNPYSKAALLGFILFLACDSCVALSYLSTTGTLPANLAVIFNFLAWFFYYPSQILVSNSSKCATID